MELEMSNGIDIEVMDSAELVLTMDPVTFAKRLAEARQAAGLTQQQVADACGLSDGTVSAWERGRATTEIVHGLEDLPVEQQEAVRSLIRSLKR